MIIHTQNLSVALAKFLNKPYNFVEFNIWSTPSQNVQIVTVDYNKYWCERIETQGYTYIRIEDYRDEYG